MKILLIANTDWYFYNYRLSLAQSLHERGYEVVLVSPSGPYVSRLQDAGFRWIEFNLSRQNTNPFVAGISILRLVRLYWQERPDIVHQFTIQCVLYGSLVSHLIGIKSVVNSITGLGYVFTDKGGAPNWLRWLITLFYRIVLRKTTVIFQNPEDCSFFLKKGIADSERSFVIRGSGVDVERFSPKPESPGDPLVVFPGRLLWAKGVEEFVNAAQLLREEGTRARFILVGDCDPGNPSSIPVEQIREWEKKKGVEWWGWNEDMNNIFAQSHLVCFPSYFKEGVPKVLIEAAACGRPIITTDMPGCREIVRSGKNGLLVPPRDPVALANGIRSLLKDPAQRERMGSVGREMAVKEFSDERIISQTLDVYHSFTQVQEARNS